MATYLQRNSVKKTFANPVKKINKRYLITRHRETKLDLKCPSQTHIEQP